MKTTRMKGSKVEKGSGEGYEAEELGI